MCYSAQIEASYAKFVQVHGAVLDIHEFVKLYGARAGSPGWTKLPKAMREAFPKPEKEAEIVAGGDRYLDDSLQANLSVHAVRLKKADGPCWRQVKEEVR